MSKKFDIDTILTRVRERGAERLVIVFNPRSSRAKQVEDVVLKPVRAKASEFLEFEVLPTNVDDNAARLAKILRDGDAVLAAGGDGTAAIAMNGCMIAEKDVFISALPFGNFNDMARSFRKAPEGAMLYPIEAKVDGKHFRFAACYFTMGLFAESTEIFDGKKMRKSLQTGRKSMVFSVVQLAKWYFKNKRREFLPGFKIVRNGRKMVVRRGTSDYMAINGKSVAKMMRGGDWYLSDKEFRGTNKRLTSFLGLGCFMARSILFRVPGSETRSDKLVFEQPATVEIQAEGEYKKIEVVKEIEFRKSRQGIRIL